MRGTMGHLSSLTFPFLFRGMAPFPCKTLLLLLGIVGLAAALLELEEGKIALPIKQL
jgi:hypothetical protein